MRFFKLCDLDKIRISELELNEPDGEEHLKAKAAACLKLAKADKEFITDCWIPEKWGADHRFVDIFVTEDFKVIEVIPFEEFTFILKQEKFWEKQNLDYEAVTY